MPANETISHSLAENLLTLLAQDDVNGKIIATTIDASLFEGEMRPIAEAFITYWRRHGTAPKTHAFDLFSDIIEDKHDRRSSTYKRIVEQTILLFEEGVNSKYVLQQLHTFTRLQKLKDAIFRAAEILNRPTHTSISDVEEILHSILRARDFQFDPGLRLDRYEVLMDYLDVHYNEFQTGIVEFDNSSIVPARGQLWMLLGGSGRGKTWGMIHIGKTALRNNKKVLYITPELSAEETMLRFYQSLWSIAKRDEHFERPFFRFDEENQRVIKSFEHRRDRPQMSLDTKTIISREIRTRAMGMEGTLNNLVIKRVAPRSMSINAMRGYLDSLENVEGFVPDMIIVDSIYLMKPSSSREERRVAIGGIIEDFRGLCIERNVAGVASHQLSREGYKSSRAGLAHVGEDWSVVQTSDIVAVLSATDDEKKLGLARLYADKVRSDKGNVAVILAQCLDIGQFKLQSHPIADQNRYWELVEKFELQKLERTERTRGRENSVAD